MKMKGELSCPICKYDCIHLIASMEFEADNYTVTNIKIENKCEFDLKLYGQYFKYPFRSQGNKHLIFECEADSHYFIQSFDGHKGTVYVNENSLMDYFAEYLNERQKLADETSFRIEFDREVKRFFIDEKKYRELDER